jgi:hypothetical protein
VGTGAIGEAEAKLAERQKQIDDYGTLVFLSWISSIEMNQFSIGSTHIDEHRYVHNEVKLRTV